MGNIFNTLLVYPLTNVLAVFNILYENIGAPGAFGLAIITFTVFIRLLLYPMYKKQNETTQKINEIRPKLDALKEKHKNDNVKMQQEQIRIYQEAGINPAAGCVLVLIQLPIFIALYQALNLFVNGTHGGVDIQSLNNILYFEELKVKALDVSFIGLNLGLTPAQGANWMYYAVPVVTAILQYFQASTAMIAPPAGAKKTADGKEKKPDTADEFQRAMQTQMKYIFPFMIGAISFNLPTALALYWNVFSIFSIIQFYIGKRNKAESKNDVEEGRVVGKEPLKQSEREKKPEQKKLNNGSKKGKK